MLNWSFRADSPAGGDSPIRISDLCRAGSYIGPAPHRAAPSRSPNATVKRSRAGPHCAPCATSERGGGLLSHAAPFLLVVIHLAYLKLTLLFECADRVAPSNRPRFTVVVVGYLRQDEAAFLYRRLGLQMIVGADAGGVSGVHEGWIDTDVRRI